MFTPIVMEEDEQYILKPMNCPHHIMIYKSKPRSYRELPLRLAEFGTVYRYEKSGELSGMTRVRGFTQDDAHIFCTEDQVADEFRGCIEMTQFVLKSLGLDDYRVRLGFVIRKATSTSAATRVGNGPAVIDRSLRAIWALKRSAGTGRSGLLRSEGRLCRHRLHRSRMAAGHRPAGLQPAERRTIRSGVHRRRQSAASTRHDPSRSAGFDGTIHRRADRTLCGRVSAVAGTRTSACADGQRKVGRVWPASVWQQLQAAGLRVDGGFPRREAGRQDPRCASWS